MSNLLFNVDPNKMNPRQPPIRLVIIAAVLSVLLFMGFSLSMFWQPLRAMMAGKHSPIAIVFIVFMLFIFLAPLAGVFSVLKKLKQNPAGAPPPPRAEKPWLARADWSAGKIISSATAGLGVLFIMGLIFTTMGGFISFLAFPKELPQGNYLLLLVLLFPAVGIGLLVYGVRQWRGQRRFGESMFVMASVPGVPGSALQGSIQTGAAFRPEQGLHLRLSCIRRTVSSSGENRQVSENVIWQDEKILKNEAVSAQGDHAGIPVYFQLPSNQPESFAHGNEAIIWRLEAKAKMSGPDFKAVFDVPVFNVAGAPPARAVTADPTAKLEMPIEEIRQDEHSKIRVSNAPGGREFYFPAARNLGSAFGITVFMLIVAAAVWFMIRLKAGFLFPIVFGIFAALLFCGCINLWFKRTRVTINSTRVSAAKHWLIFGGTRLFDAGDVAHFECKIGMQSGQQVFQDIQLITRTDKRFTVATSIASKPEADWLVQEMNKALGRAT
jgi:hypothetical protein